MTATALLLIDIQNDYFQGGAMELVGTEAAALNAASLLALFRNARWPIVHIQHLSVQPGASFFLPGTPGADIHASVAPQPGETVFQKHYPSSFRETPLHQHLQDHGITQLVVAGHMTHMCIDTTVRAAFDLGYRNLLVHDACATRDLHFAGRTVGAADVQAAYLAALGSVFAQTIATADVPAALTAANP